MTHYWSWLKTFATKLARNSFCKAFPLATLGGCRFFLGQALIGNVNECGLKHKYIKDHHFRLRVKCLPALIFIPEPIIKECLELSCGDFEDDELAVLNYFERTYIGAINPRSEERWHSQYSLEVWNMRDRSLLGAPLTTNHSEGWQARLYSACGLNNPNFGISCTCWYQKWIWSVWNYLFTKSAAKGEWLLMWKTRQKSCILFAWGIFQAQTTKKIELLKSFAMIF